MQRKTDLHCSSPKTSEGKLSTDNVSWGRFFVMVLLTQVCIASSLATRHSGPPSAMNTKGQKGHQRW